MTNSLLFVFLQSAPGGGGSFQLILLGGMILVFWLFMIRPQAKKAKLAKKFQQDMQKDQRRRHPRDRNQPRQLSEDREKRHLHGVDAKTEQARSGRSREKIVKHAEPGPPGSGHIGPSRAR